MVDVSNIKDWKKAMFFSFISYSLVLFAIVVVVTFAKKDFDFKLVALIGGAYMGAVLFFMLVAAVVFSRKLDHE
ncbi:MAG: hypothetical protein JXA98_05235 [Methanosarcinaceae archaeon]|nr:hypothetical protein [Methanosarcinaceae archaeon]